MDIIFWCPEVCCNNQHFHPWSYYSKSWKNENIKQRKVLNTEPACKTRTCKGTCHVRKYRHKISSIIVNASCWPWMQLSIKAQTSNIKRWSMILRIWSRIWVSVGSIAWTGIRKIVKGTSMLTWISHWYQY